MIIALTLFLIFFSIIAYLRSDLAVLIIITLLPSYLIRFHIGSMPTTLLEVMIIISFATWLGKNILPNLKDWFKQKAQRISYPFNKEIIIILLLAWLSAGVAGFNLSALGVWKAYFFEPIIFFILILNVLPGKQGRNKIITALLLSAIGIALIAIFQKITGLFIFNSFWADANTRRVVSWFGYPNAVGLFLAPIIMVLTGWLASLPKISNWKDLLKKVIIITTIILSALSIYFAKSEGALIALIVAFFLFFVLASYKTRVIAIIGAIISITIIFSVPTLRTFATDKLLLRDLSGEIRQQQWKESINSFTGWRILLGNGLNGYQKAIAPYHQEGIFFNSDKIDDFDSVLYGDASLRAKYWQPVEIYLYPHNIFLNFWSELGILGALIFAWLIIKYLITSLKLFCSKEISLNRERYLSLGLFSAMIVIIIHGLVDVPYFKNDLSIIFFILLALLGSLNLDLKNKISIK